MYIAFKWLLGLSLAMWFVMCCIDIYFNSMKKFNKTGYNLNEVKVVCKNSSIRNNVAPKEGLKLLPRSKNQVWSGIFNYGAFCAAGIFLSLIHKKKEVVMGITKHIKNVDTFSLRKYVSSAFHLKRTAIDICDAITKNTFLLWNFFKNIVNYCNRYCVYRLQGQDNTNMILLKKLNTINEERKNLSLLLAAAICENKNLRFNYHLHSMAKKRLAIDMEEAEKKIKESRSHYVNFQNLYLVTHQDNIYLKARIKKLTKQKEDAEKNLINLVHEVCLSKNKELMAYCSRFVVQTREKLLCSDMSAEIKHFLRTTSSAGLKTSERPDVGTNTSNKPKHEFSEENESLVPLNPGPRLVGLPGEHIWTVKDNGGFIEKIYEYDFESDFDNGDTIRRIREYSVYHDKDSFLEKFDSRTVLNDDSNGAKFHENDLIVMGRNKRISNRRFLTGSEVFQVFLQNTQNIIVPVTSTVTPIAYR